MSAAYIECFSGMKIERLLGAWFELGLPLEEWKEYMTRMGLNTSDILVERVKVKDIAATAVQLFLPELPDHLSISNIEKLIDRWELPQMVKNKSKLVFQNWAAAEAKVRNTSPNSVSIGNLQSLGTIIGNILAWHLLGEPKCYVSTIQLGNSWNQSDEDWKLLSDPVTTELLLGYPTVSSGKWEEMTDVMAAAFIRTLAVPAPQQAFIGEKVAYGAAPEILSTPNIVRIQRGKWCDSSQTGDFLPPKKQTIVIETNIDDMNPEWAGHLVQRLLSLGARDAYLIPIIMKKGRPGLLLRVACTSDKQLDIQKEIVRQTTTIGMRYYTTGSWSVPNKIVHVQTSYGNMPVKIAFLDGNIVNVAPEYEACRQMAESLDASVKKVYQTVLGEALKQYQINT